MIEGSTVVAGSVDGILAAPQLKASGERGQPGHHLRPVDSESVTVAVGGVVGHSRDGEVTFAVIGLGVVDGSGKMAAAENVAGKIDAAGVGNGLIGRVVARLIQVGRNGEGDEVGIVVITGERARAADREAVVGRDIVSVASVIARGDGAVQVRAEFAEPDLRSYGQYEQEEACQDQNRVSESTRHLEPRLVTFSFYYQTKHVPGKKCCYAKLLICNGLS